VRFDGGAGVLRSGVQIARQGLDHGGRLSGDAQQNLEGRGRRCVGGVLQRSSSKRGEAAHRWQGWSQAQQVVQDAHGAKAAIGVRQIDEHLDVAEGVFVEGNVIGGAAEGGQPVFPEPGTLG